VIEPDDDRLTGGEWLIAWLLVVVLVFILCQVARYALT
jgi:hypothetical protein